MSDVAIRIRVAAILVEAGQVLLVQHEKAGRTYYMLPGGGVDAGESLTQALERELAEETGITICAGDLVLASDAIAPDGSRHVLNLCFTATRIDGDLMRGEDPRIVAVDWVPVANLQSIPLFPDFGAALQTAIEANFPERVRYLGNLWIP